MTGIEIFFTDLTFLTATLGGLFYLCALIIQIFYLFRKRKKTDHLSHFVLLAGAVLLLIHLINRSLRISFVAVTNTFESLVLYAAAIGIVIFFYSILSKDKVLPFIPFGGAIISIILLAVASSPLAAKEILPPIPALQSYWLVLHVSFAFIGEAFFAIGFVVAIAYLIHKNDDKRKELDRIMYTCIAIGYPLFTAGGLIFGAIWAEVAWGSYWSWDPKETWALITWLTYTAYLHTRFIKKLRGKVSAWLSIAGFAFTIFTLFGVNFLLSGLHSYS